MDPARQVIKFVSAPKFFNYIHDSGQPKKFLINTEILDDKNI